MKKLYFALFTAVALTACASAGNVALKQETSQTIATKIAKGHTTQAEVRAFLGSPDSTNFTDSGNQVWHYTRSESTAMGRNFIPYANLFSSGQNVETKQLVIFFDKEGVVQNYSMEESKSQVKQGILRQ